jgi:uncharacterized protein YqfB (UPF0267 family)
MAKKKNQIINSVEYSTIHIFGYGETQLISSDSNKKVATSTLTKVQAVIDNVYSKNTTLYVLFFFQLKPCCTRKANSKLATRPIYGNLVP